MHRIVLFLLLIALAAAGAAWVADQPGEVVLTWGGWRAHPSLPVFALLLGIVIVAAILLWSALRALWKMPEKIRHGRREKRQKRAHSRHRSRGTSPSILAICVAVISPAYRGNGRCSPCRRGRFCR